jgi:hypothetical protein
MHLSTGLDTLRPTHFQNQTTSAGLEGRGNKLSFDEGCEVGEWESPLGVVRGEVRKSGGGT